jgi:hypothetical protein
MLEIDFSEFTRAAIAFGNAAENQVPFAIARSLNDGVKAARDVLVQNTWPTHVQQRNAGFIGWALRSEYATKRNLSVAIYDRSPNQRGHLRLHAKGGSKTAKGRLAIPDSKNVKPLRGAKGVPSNLRPLNLSKSFRKGDVIYRRVGGKKAKNRHLKLMYVLKRGIFQPKDVPFYEDFAFVMREQLRTSFPVRIREAIASARR